MSWHRFYETVQLVPTSSALDAATQHYYFSSEVRFTNAIGLQARKKTTSGAGTLEAYVTLVPDKRLVLDAADGVAPGTALSSLWIRETVLDLTSQPVAGALWSSDITQVLGGTAWARVLFHLTVTETFPAGSLELYLACKGL